MTHASFPASDHDHRACIHHALDQAESYCTEHDLRLTDLRRKVLTLIWDGHRPVGAYQLLDELGKEGRRAAPPTVYRTLDFLLSHGLIHRIASMNAYIGCAHPGEQHAPGFFICDHCGLAAEMEDPAIDTAIRQDARDLGFHVSRQTVEISGTCSACHKQKAPSGGMG